MASLAPPPVVAGRLGAAETLAAAADRDSRRLSSIRLGYVLAAALALSWWDQWHAAAVIAAALPFVPLARLHRRAERRAQHARGVAAACRAAIARMERRWSAVPAARTPDLRALGLDSAMAHDLDVTGDVSLFRLLDVGLAGSGPTILRWLLADPASLETIRARQASVAALRDRVDLLLENARLSRFARDRRPAPTEAQMTAFREWCAGAPRPTSPLLLWTGRTLTALVLLAIIATTTPAWRDPAVLAVSLLIPAQLLVAGLARRQLRRELGASVELLERLGDVVEILRLIVAAGSTAGRFGALQDEFRAGRAVDAFASLGRLVDWNAVRHAPLLHFAANAATGFDTHLAHALDRWRLRHGAALPQWIDRVAEAQALLALATLASENEGWAMPHVHDDAAPVFDAADCGHPLIAPAVRVTNPVALAAAAETLVITGSNMSGKTTYLRAVGLNALLANAGGAVCARTLSVRRSRVRTSVRIEDDLAHGSSLFFAEVSRIRDVVAAAAQRARAPVLFLLDEILHGTNASDRRLATQLVLERLVASGASGIITTHDAGVGEVPGAVTNVHFTDTVAADGDDVRMTFDYRLRPGVATSANALRILHAMGLRA